jgi:hypothetical protein
MKKDALGILHLQDFLFQEIMIVIFMMIKMIIVMVLLFGLAKKVNKFLHLCIGFILYCIVFHSIILNLK